MRRAQTITSDSGGQVLAAASDQAFGMELRACGRPSGGFMRCCRTGQGADA
jgi:hypothetical protein